MNAAALGLGLLNPVASEDDAVDVTRCDQHRQKQAHSGAVNAAVPLAEGCHGRNGHADNVSQPGYERARLNAPVSGC